MNPFFKRIKPSGLQVDQLQGMLSRLHHRLEGAQLEMKGEAILRSKAEQETALVAHQRDLAQRELAALRSQLAEAQADARRYQSALVRYNGETRSFFQIANRIATEMGTHALQTNFGGFAEVAAKLLKDTHELTNAARRAADGE